MIKALVGFTLLFCWKQCIYAQVSPKYFIAAPNLLRVGIEETVSVSVFDVNGDVDIQLSLQDFPNRRKTFSRVSGRFRAQQPGLLKIKVNANDLHDLRSLDKQYVYLKASSNTPGIVFNDEIKILVSYRNTMVFIRTDKPIYNPGQTVNLRVIPLGLDLTASKNNVTIEILNPQGIRVARWKDLNTNEGFFSRRYELSENVLLGVWKINALYGHGRVQNASIKFEVKEYILPKFSVNIEGPSYILENDSSISIKIKSEYTYGEGVQGAVRVNLAVLDDSGKAERFSTSLHLLQGGKATVNVQTNLIKDHPKILWFPDGKRLLIEAKVTEQATGTEEKAMDNKIYFTNSPLKISFKRSPKFFKPGVPFLIKVDVTYVNGKPAENIDIEIDAKTDGGVAVLERAVDGVQASGDKTNQLGHGAFVIDIPRLFTINRLDIKVSAKTNQGGVDIISEAMFQPTMYSSSGNNYLFVRFLTKAKVGESVVSEAFVLSNQNPSSLTYLVIANGRVVTQGSIDRNLGVVTSIRLLVTPEMSPQARFIAYYHANNELVVDSAIMEVEEELPNKVTFLGNQHPQKLPGQPHKIEIQSSPHSHVGVLAVDQSVYLLRDDKHLTSDEVFKRMKSHDLGCGAGAGMDNKDVLRRGGLAVMTSINNLKTDTREDFNPCAPDARRRRRSADDVVDQACCLLGQLSDPATCKARAMSFSNSNLSSSFHPRDACVIQFYTCCYKAFEMDHRGRSGDVDIPNDLLNNLPFDGDKLFMELALEQAQMRTNFPEKWLFEDAKAGKNGRVMFPVTVPDTITSWVLQAIAVSNTTGFGVTPSFSLKVFKPLFLSLKLPYSAQRGEQISVITTVFNYKATDEKVYIFLEKQRGDHYCTYSESGRGGATYTVQVKGHGATSVSFPIVPTEIGEMSIGVKIISGNGEGDGVRRTFKVLPEGMERRQTYSVVLDPLDVLRDPAEAQPTTAPTTPSKIQTSKQGNGEQKNRLSITLPNSTIPESEYALLTVIGNLIGPAVSNIIEGRGLDSIIKLPTGCGEQTMLKLAPNVFVLNYLRSTKQVTRHIEETAFNYIRSGYQHELNYRKTDHSFSAFQNRPGSTWLTAFVMKTFCAIQKLDGIDIDQNVIDTGIHWLTSRQRADGAIPENHPVIHQEMDGDINSDITMTAYVVTAFIECNSFTPNSVQTVRNAVAYLENARPNVGRVYVKAVIAYALALADSPQKLNANQDLINSAIYDGGKNTRYWHDGQGGNAIDVETTSYALLTQMVLKRRGYAGPIVVWLTEQRKGGGGFISTQDTCVALQALAAYSEETGGDQMNLRIEITTDREYKKTLTINQNNALVQQQLDITNLIGDELFIETKGSGVAQLQIESRYNTPLSEIEVCQFDLVVTTVEREGRFYDPPILVKPKPTKSPNRSNRKGNNKKCRKNKGKKCTRRRRCKGKRRRRCKNKGSGRRRAPKPTTPARPITTRPPQNDAPAPNTVSIKICTKFKKAGENAGMSIIDVGILTGFSVKQETLVELRDKVKPGIAKFEISDRHAVLYVDKIPSSHHLCFNLELQREFEVGIVQPVPVTVYDYYDPDNRCTKYYGPETGSRLNLATCEHDSCKCAIDKCASCKPSNDANNVVDELCKKYDYGFKGKLRNIDEKGKWLRLTFDIEDVYRESATKKITKRTRRIVYSKSTECDCPRFARKIDSDFLIMGTDHGLLGSNQVKMGASVFVKELPRNSADFFREFLRTLKKGC
ncbi:complement C3-like [Dendronephthya gigantea]|uniref:complement C3-like n=1 Tax=Dendronephthya gigantea TaxID=151771 RepID=UPI00106D3B77|nr:complement C3-like [Dendronephthya gigantea]